MAKGWQGYKGMAAAGAVLAAGLAYAFWPRPLAVDMAGVTQGPLRVTLESEGKTRVREAYTVSAPVAGRLLRIEVHAGDAVQANGTVLARIEPSDPAFLDARSRGQAEATVKAAEAARALAAADLASARAERDFAKAELARAKALAERGTISESARDKAEMAARTKAAQVNSAEAALRMRAFELETARASLIDPSGNGARAGTCCVSVRAPVDGTVLRVVHEDEGVVPAGTALLEMGNPTDQEIVADLLSEDAVKAAPGMAVSIEDWGGPGVLHGRVRRIEPYGYTKISALGVEEQRVNVLIDITDPPSLWARLGHGYRVKVRIVLSETENAVRVPLGALFRDGNDWATFVVSDGRARLRRLTLGGRDGHRAEVTAGAAPGDRVVLHPGNRIEDGARVAPRTMEIK